MKGKLIMEKFSEIEKNYKEEMKKNNEQLKNYLMILLEHQ